MSLQITRAGVRVPPDAVLAAWRRELDVRHAIKVPGLLEPALLDRVRVRLQTAPFAECVHTDLDPPAVDLLLNDPALQLMVWSIFNDARLFDVVRRLSACDEIGCYQSRVYAFDPLSSHDSWHSDADGNRMVAMSVNLGGAYDGGILQIRDASSKALLNEVRNVVAGDAALFRIRDGLEHYVTPLAGTRRRVVVAGWFQRAPRALDVLRRRR